jgi:hypothetical protein
MRRYFLLFLGMHFWAVILVGQSINFGVVTSLNGSSYGVNRDNKFRRNFDFPLNYGGSVGFAINYGPSREQISRKFPFKFALQTEAQLNTTYFLTRSSNDQINIELETYEITRFVYNLMGGFTYKSKFQFVIGPTFNTILAAKKTVDYRNTDSRIFPDSDIEFKRFGIGLNTSFGYWWRNFLFSVQYERQLTDFRTSLFNSPVKFKMNTLRIGTTYFLFNKNNEKNRDSLFGL